MNRKSLAAAAVISAAALMVPAAPALAAGHGHGHGTGHQHTATAHGRAKQAHGHLAKQLRGADHAVANQLRQVNRMADLVANSTNVSDTDRAAVTSALQADVDALTTLQTQLDAVTSHHDVVAALHQGILIRAVARTQTTVAEEAGAVRAAAATATDSTAAGTATSDADAAVAAVVALSPDSTRAQINQARATAEAALADADTVLGISTAPTDGGDTTPTSGTSTPTG